MCGIYGGVGIKVSESSFVSAMKHRGPDATGIFRNGSVCLGHLRLSINDLSMTGAQPFKSSDGRYVIVYNGEIYNVDMLKTRFLQGVSFKGTSDTEVLVELIAKIGVKRALNEVDSMFSVAVWDSQQRELHLARDRTGQKPLFIYNDGGNLLFASELNALLSGLSTVGRPNLNMHCTSGFIHCGYMSALETVVEGISKLKPGVVLSFNISKEGRLTPPRESLYVENEPHEDALGSPSRTQDFLAIFQDSVRRHLISDVPVGIALSGGVDSSLVAACVPDELRAQITAYTVGFENVGFDERGAARDTSASLGIRHLEFVVTAQDLQHELSSIGENFGEPVADLSVIPLSILAARASADVKVLLGGDGGDELFHGYNRYLFWWRFGALIQDRYKLKGLLADAAAAGGRFASRIGTMRWASYLDKMSVAFRATNVENYYLSAVGLSDIPGTPVWYPRPSKGATADDVFWMAQQDLSDYLPNCVLVKSDRATMASSIEARSPFLSKSVIDFAARLPSSQKIRNSHGKVLLREVLRKKLPAIANNKRKSGFSVPISEWLRGPLREQAWDVLSSKKNQDFFNQIAINPLEVLRQHDNRELDQGEKIWRLLVIADWIEKKYAIH